MLVNSVCGYGKEVTRKIFSTEKGTIERFRFYNNKERLYSVLINNDAKGLVDDISKYHYTGTDVIKRFKDGKLFSKTVIVGDGNKHAKSGLYHTRFYDNGAMKIETGLDRIG